MNKENLVTPINMVRIWDGTTVDLNNIAMISDAYLHQAGHGYMAEAHVGCEITTISGKNIVIKEYLDGYGSFDKRADYSFELGSSHNKWLTVDGEYRNYEDIEDKNDIACVNSLKKKVDVLIDAWNKNKAQIIDLYEDDNNVE